LYRRSLSSRVIPIPLLPGSTQCFAGGRLDPFIL
jgi:hypothetical protein